MLEGHEGIVSTIVLIEETNQLLSSDEYSNIKSWDLNSNKCIQTFTFPYNTLIYSISVIDPYKFFAVSNKIYLFSFMPENRISNHRQNQFIHKEPNGDSNIELVDVHYSYHNKMFVVSTRRDIRLIDGDTGQTTRLYSSIA